MGKVSPSAGGSWLRAGAIMSLLAALLHIGVIFGGSDWYRFFGAPEELALEAERGEILPAIMTSAIAGVLALWAAFAASGAGVLPRLPLLRTALVTIAAIYMARGLLLVPVLVVVPYPEGAFDYWSSAIVLIIGVVHTIGTIRAWPSLNPSN